MDQCLPIFNKFSYYNETNHDYYNIYIRESWDIIILLQYEDA